MWKDALQELPKIQDYYLVQRINYDDGDGWYDVEFFEPQEEYERKYSKEFNQHVTILVKSSEPSFKDSGNSFVIRWMEIPKYNMASELK